MGFSASFVGIVGDCMLPADALSNVAGGFTQPSGGTPGNDLLGVFGGSPETVATWCEGRAPAPPTFMSPGMFGPTYCPPAPAAMPAERWTDGGLACNGTFLGDAPVPPKSMFESWGSYVGRLDPGQVDKLVESGGIPASELEKDPALALAVQTKMGKFSSFLQMVSNLVNSQTHLSESIARNIQP